jgi:hypothetical protein
MSGWRVSIRYQWFERGEIQIAFNWRDCGNNLRPRIDFFSSRRRYSRDTEKYPDTVWTISLRDSKIYGLWWNSWWVCVLVCQILSGKIWLNMINHPISEVHNCDSYPYGGFHSHGDTPIAGWFIVEYPWISYDQNRWFGGTSRRPPYEHLVP